MIFPLVTYFLADFASLENLSAGGVISAFLNQFGIGSTYFTDLKDTLDDIKDMFNGANSTLLDTFVDNFASSVVRSSPLTTLVEGVGEKIKAYFTNATKLGDFGDWLADRVPDFFNNISIPTWKFWNINRIWSTYKDRQFFANTTDMDDNTNQGGFN